MLLAVLKFLYEEHKKKVFFFKFKDGTLVHVMHVMDKAISS
jgi:hypothetical protein